MKYGKILSNQLEETLPDWEDKYLSYKELKKRLKLINQKVVERANEKLGDDDFSIVSDEADDLSRQEEMDFIRFLEAELDKFNWFFEDKEQDYIIRSKELQDRVAKTKKSSNDRDSIMKARRDVLDFHGEMVLLECYSALNYTGLVKILKKYDKQRGAFIRFSFIQKVLQQPFVTTDLLNDLLKDCEMMLNHLFSMTEPSVTSSAVHHENANFATRPVTATSKNESLTEGGGEELTETEYMESLYLRSTLSALRALKEIRSGSRTRNVSSMPPMM
ncbi:hypothetical protein C5167_011054 [Papaver somniferum]|uniref:SPX domain-containing protein n=1 Tax=Papaver somniferum TaxID=3469 RepID=A0A4Y7K1X3_PAPSO|nr:SPX domain-containing protein 2-like [Papaver somniferum]RZC67363.1 hypothetical protein C5167_011054 [Papaver somniferum]